MNHLYHLTFINAARNAILVCDVIQWTPNGWQISMESLRAVWRTYGTGYFNLALYQLVQQGRVRILAVDRVFLTNASWHT